MSISHDLTVKIIFCYFSQSDVLSFAVVYYLQFLAGLMYAMSCTIIFLCCMVHCVIFV